MPTEASSRAGLTMSGNASATFETSGVSQHDGLGRRHAGAAQHLLGLVLVQREPERERRRARVGEARALEQQRQQRLEVARAVDRLAQVEDDVGREGGDLCDGAVQIARRRRPSRRRIRLRSAENLRHAAAPFPECPRAHGSPDRPRPLRSRGCERPRRAAREQTSRSIHSSDPIRHCNCVGVKRDVQFRAELARDVAPRRIASARRRDAKRREQDARST